MAQNTKSPYDPSHPVHGLEALLIFSKDHIKESWFHEGQYWNFCANTWDAPQGSFVQVPSWMTNGAASALTSHICQEKQKQANLGGTIPIKKVAEIRGSRFNTGKLRMDLIDGLAQEGLAAVLTKGVEKYSANNWRQGMPYMEVIASLLRHVAKITQGEDVDAETGLMHADHIQCNAMFLSNMMKTRPDMDDRVAAQRNLSTQNSKEPRIQWTEISLRKENSSKDASS